MTEGIEELLSDAEIARALKMSKQWVRVQRHKRRRGEAHYLQLDPVMIGSKPRYLRDEFEALLTKLKLREGSTNAG